MWCRIDRGSGESLDKIIRTHLESERNAGEVSHLDWSVLKELYELLNILDAKTSSLLTFDGILLAVYVIVLQNAHSPTPEPPCLRLLNLVGTLLTSISAGICVWVAKMSWAFLLPKRSITDECSAVADKVDERTRLYQAAWMLSSVGLVGAILVVLAMALR